MDGVRFKFSGNIQSDLYIRQGGVILGAGKFCGKGGSGGLPPPLGGERPSPLGGSMRQKEVRCKRVPLIVVFRLSMGHCLLQLQVVDNNSTEMR